MGGRSRVAAQMLAGKGFDNVYNVTGGFKAWESKVAFGKEELGLELFTGDESPEITLVVAYSLEQGLLDFYLSMIPKVKNDDVKNLFKKLSEIEVKHRIAFLTNTLRYRENRQVVKNLRKTLLLKLWKEALLHRSIWIFSSQT